MAEIGMNNGLVDVAKLPAGWTFAPIGTLFDSWGGHTPSKANASFWGPGIPWASSRDIKSERVSSTTHEVTEAAVAKTGLRVCPAGSVLVVVRSGILAHSLPVAIADRPVVINQDLKAFYSSEPLMNEWLAAFLNACAPKLLARSRREGTTVQSVQYPMLKETEIPVPPLAVRHAILEMLRQASQKQSSASPRILVAERAIERFRQSVLVAASSGRLTADWREKRGLSEWETMPAAAACAKVQSGSTPKVWYEEEGGIPFLKVYNIVDQKLDFGYRSQFITPELFRDKFARTKALPGDVLMNIVGPPLGKVAIVTDQFPEWSINQALTLFRPSSLVSTDWLYIFLCSGISVDEVMNDTKGTVGQINISLTQCREFELPIPSMDEQAEITYRVSALLKIANDVTKRLGVAVRQVERSSQAVLAKAFRGELLPS